jgi:hypothetical protein
MSAPNLEGRAFELLAVKSRAKNDSRYSCWNCVCVCGKKITVRGVSLTSGNTKSCGGCWHRLYPPGTIEGREYHAYLGAKGRCRNPRNKDYATYGGAGVLFLFRDFAQFLAELGPAPSPDHTVDRIGNGDYAPGRVRWATPAQQAWHRLKTRRKTSSRYKGVTRAKGGWQASITCNNKYSYLGTFSIEEHAALAYDKAAREHFGGFACCNFPQEAA